MAGFPAAGVACICCGTGCDLTASAPRSCRSAPILQAPAPQSELLGSAEGHVLLRPRTGSKDADLLLFVSRCATLAAGMQMLLTFEMKRTRPAHAMVRQAEVSRSLQLLLHGRRRGRGSAIETISRLST